MRCEICIWNWRTGGRKIDTEVYCYSWDGESYQGEFDSEEEAIESAQYDYPDREYVYIGTCTEPTLSWNSNEEQIIESIIENLSDDVGGDYAENFEVSTEDELELARMIDETVKEWIEKCKIKPSCYSVLDGHQVSLKV